MQQEEFENLANRIHLAALEVEDLQNEISKIDRADAMGLQRVVHKDAMKLKEQAWLLHVWVGR
jgi:hypothetical protein